MTRYTLPDGTTAEQAINHTTPNGRRWVKHPTLGLILIDANKLTEVKPPLPPEPTDPRAYVLVTDPAGVNEVFRRRAGEWFSVSEFQRIGLSWAQLHERGTVTVLIPDPADDAPALPFAIHGDNGETAFRVTLWPSLEHPRTGSVTVLGNVSEMSAAELRAGGAAMLRAAREVEQP